MKTKTMKKDKETENFLKLIADEPLEDQQKSRGSWIQGRVNVVYRKEIKQLRGKRP